MQTIPTSPFDAFVTYGTTGLDLALAHERREAERMRVSAAHQLSVRPSPVRHWLGAVMIRAGEAIAGARECGTAQPASLHP